MGLNILSFFKNKITKEQKIAFSSTFLCTLLVHLYYFSNGFPGRDSFTNNYATQNVLGSGRWALSVACAASSYYDLPWVISIISCLFIALTAVVLVSLFRIENPVFILVTSGLLASSPTITETFFFLYTADGYMIAMALAAAAVYFSRIDETRWSFWVLSAACICISCGIYQAYVSLALILAVCYFMTELFVNRFEKKAYLLWVVRQAGIYIVGLVSYYLIWKLCMNIQEVRPSDYQGIADVGTLSANLLINGLFSSIRTFKWYFAPWSVATYGFTPYIFLNFLFVLFFVGSIILAVWKSGIWKRVWSMILVFLCLIAIVPFSSIWHFTSDSVFYRAMMLPGMTVLFLFAALNFERWGKQWIKNLFMVLLMAIILNNTVMANIAYFHMNLCYERSYGAATAMFVEIQKLQKDYNFQQYTVVGQRYEEAALKGNDPEYGTTNEIGQIQLFANTLDENLLYEERRVGFLLETVLGLDLERIPQRSADVSRSDAVRNMPFWPENGSVAVVEDMLVIKISDSY